MVCLFFCRHFFSQLPVCCFLFVLLLCLYSFHHLTELSLLVFSVTVMWYLVTSALYLSLFWYTIARKRGKKNDTRKSVLLFFFWGGTVVGWVVDCAFLSWKEVDTTLRDIYIYVEQRKKEEGKQDLRKHVCQLVGFLFFFTVSLPLPPPHPPFTHAITQKKIMDRYFIAYVVSFFLSLFRVFSLNRCTYSSPFFFCVCVYFYRFQPVCTYSAFRIVDESFVIKEGGRGACALISAFFFLPVVVVAIRSLDAW